MNRSAAIALVAILAVAAIVAAWVSVLGPEELHVGGHCGCPAAAGSCSMPCSGCCAPSSCSMGPIPCCKR